MPGMILLALDMILPLVCGSIEVINNLLLQFVDVLVLLDLEVVSMLVVFECNPFW